MLAAVPWIIDSTASSLTLAIPDQNVVLDGTNVLVAVRNQSGGNAGPWNVGNTAAISGTIQTEYVDGSSIQFLAGQTGILGVNSGSYRPDPASFDGTTFTTTNTAPGVFGARVRATVSVFGFPVTQDAGFVSFYNTSYEIASGSLPITAGNFPVNTTEIGIAQSQVAIDGLSIPIVGQPVADQILSILDTVAINAAATGTITTTGTYTRRLTAPISLALSIPIDEDPSHNLVATATGTVVADATLPPSSIVGRHLFYNQSGTASPLRYDGNNAAINANDDLAIATDKVAYLPGSGPSTFANVSSYTKGINGVMIDIAGAHGTITAADFIFRVGNNNTPNSWTAAPAPNSISVRAGAGVSGADRVVLTWTNGAITKQWLEVVVLANANTNLSPLAGYPTGQADVFFFGNALGDSGSGDTSTQANVNATDELAARNNPQSVFNNIPITNLFDYNRDAQVNSTDALVARNNPTSIGNVTRFITVANPPAAPQASPADDNGAVASALSAPSADAALRSAAPRRWLVEAHRRLESIDLPPIHARCQFAEPFEAMGRRFLSALDQLFEDLDGQNEWLG